MYSSIYKSSFFSSFVNHCNFNLSILPTGTRLHVLVISVRSLELTLVQTFIVKGFSGARCTVIVLVGQKARIWRNVPNWKDSLLSMPGVCGERHKIFVFISPLSRDLPDHAFILLQFILEGLISVKKLAIVVYISLVKVFETVFGGFSEFLLKLLFEFD